jgi:molybdate/tungstate transport system substrate-binding protein
MHTQFGRSPDSRVVRRALVAFATGLALLAAGCGSSHSSSAPATSSSAHNAAARSPGRHFGSVDVLSAGSLDTVLTTSIGPAFHRATGDTLVDTSGGSSSLAADIKDKVDRADVFVSASPAVNTTLMGAGNGNWVSWYGAFAASPLVLGYYPSSRFASALRSKPWYEVVTMPGFRLGRTDPTQDPGGVLDARALTQAAATHHSAALRRLGTETSDEYAENSEQADVLSGQLDGAFMYEADATSQHSPFVPLAGIHLAGDYTVTLLRGAPHAAAGEAFIRFLTGPQGQRLMKADHFEIVSPARVTGTGVPAGLKRALGS